MIDIILLQFDFEAARKRSEKLIDRHTSSPTRLRAIPNYELIGALGEIAFEKYLRHTGLSWSAYGLNVGVAGDDYDYMVTVGDRQFFVDVKATTKYSTIAVNERQYIRASKKLNVLVGVRVDLHGRRAVILGYCWPSELRRDASKDTEVGGKAVKMYSIPNSALRRFKDNDCSVV